MKFKSVVRYDKSLQIRQCYKCQGFGHVSIRYRKEWIYNYCTRNHKTGTCTKKTDQKVVRCNLYSGGHKTWSSICPTRENEWLKMRYNHKNKVQGFVYTITNKKPSLSLFSQTSISSFQIPIPFPFILSPSIPFSFSFSFSNINQS